MKNIAAVLFMLAMMIHARGARCEQLPDAPKPLTAMDRVELAALDAVYLDDALSTGYALRHGCHEMFLPDTLARSRTGMIAFGVVKSYGQSWLMRHHRKVGRVVVLADILSTGYFATHNWLIAGER